MADFGFTPNLTASGDILPFRFVTMSGAFQGAAAAAITNYPVGVSDGSVANFANTQSGGLHASSGLPITLQPSNTVQIELGGTVAAGDFLMPKAASAGVAVTATGSTAVSAYIALEAGATGEVIRAFRFGFRGPVFA